MTDAAQPQLAIDSFSRFYDILSRGSEALVPEKEILPVPAADVVDIDSLPGAPEDGRILNHVAVIKLNGGLGTTMGLEIPKAAIEARDGRSFLDLTVQQILGYGRDHDVSVPLVLMTSFSTCETTLKLLEPYRGDLSSRVPGLFVQHKFPKVLAGTLLPATWEANPDLEWNPPGHGDLYAALVTSRMLDALSANDIRYAFVSNIDNLGAGLDLRLLSFLVNSRCPFLMEVTGREPADHKGGHLGRRANGRLMLREVAQCPAGDLPAFQDTARHRFFNTNNIWIDLRALKRLLDQYGGLLPLPLIQNEKNLDPRNHRTPRVYQLESAMGAAIEFFAGARAVRVGRDRFIPVKRCEDLLALWSDRYTLTERWEVKANPACASSTIAVALDPRAFGRMDQLRGRFPYGAPSLVECESLTVSGDVIFGKDVRLKGRVSIVNPRTTPMLVPDHSVIEQR